jgi:hypothetical protein
LTIIADTSILLLELWGVPIMKVKGKNRISLSSNTFRIMIRKDFYKYKVDKFSLGSKIIIN